MKQGSYIYGEGGLILQEIGLKVIYGLIQWKTPYR